MKTITGNLLKLAQDGQFDVIVHGCNIHCTMGSGIAATIARVFPKAYEVDLETVSGDMRKLGKFTKVEIDCWEKNQFTLINLYTQGTFGRRGVHVDYDAIQNGFYAINLLYPNARVGIPKIGAGLGGGDWDHIKMIIESIGFKDITCVEYSEE